MSSVSGIAAINNLRLTHVSSSRQYKFLETLNPNNLKVKSRAKLCTPESSNSAITNRNRNFRNLKSVDFDTCVTSDDEDEMSEGCFEAIEELERMTREPSDVLEEMNDKLSARELQLVLLYFSKEGRDSWFTLEVFEWLQKENRVDKETMELMVSIMCSWMKNLIERKNKVGDVVDLLVEIDCVGLKPSFSMIEKVICFYWELGDKDGAVLFVKEVLRRGITCLDGDKRDSWFTLEVFEWLQKENRVDKETMELMVSIMCSWMKNLIERKNKVGDVVDLLVEIDCVGLKPSFRMIEKVICFYWELGDKDSAVLFVKEVLRRGITCLDGDNEENKGGPVGYLAWKMMVDGNYMAAAKLVMHLRESGLKPELYSYLIAMKAVEKELNELGKALRKLKALCSKSGMIAELDPESVGLINKYQDHLLNTGLHLSNWAIEEAQGNSSIHGVVCEQLVAIYIWAGRGSDAERRLWEMKLLGKKVEEDIYDIVLAICASQKEVNSIARLLTRVEVMSSVRREKAYLWLLRGYVKGGHFESAAETLVKMLDCGFCPELLYRAAVLQGLRRRGNAGTYLNLCKRLWEADLIGPALVYLYIKKHKLWVVKMV